MILHSKVSGDCGGGGSSEYSALSSHHVFNANLILHIDSIDGVVIRKNRWGKIGKVSTEELIDILCRILVEHVFDGRMKLFQVGMEKRLKWAVNRIIKKG